MFELLPVGFELHEEFVYWQVGMATDSVPAETLLGEIPRRPTSGNISYFCRMRLSRKKKINVAVQHCLSQEGGISN